MREMNLLESLIRRKSHCIDPFIDLSFNNQHVRWAGWGGLRAWHRLLDIILGNFELITVHCSDGLPVIKARISLQVKMVVANFMEGGTKKWGV